VKSYTTKLNAKLLVLLCDSAHPCWKCSMVSECVIYRTPKQNKDRNIQNSVYDTQPMHHWTVQTLRGNPHL